MLKFILVKHLVRSLGKSLIQRGFLLLLVICSIASSPNFLSAQSIPVSARYEPASFSHGDEISLKISIGTAAQQVSYAKAIQLKVNYEAFSISSASSIFQEVGSTSWFANQEEFLGTQTIDPEKKQLIINLFRKNGSAASGYGHTTTLRGIVIEMEEIYGKKNIEPGAIEISLMQDVQKKLGINWNLQAEDQRILFQNFGESVIEEVIVFNFSGQKVIHETGDIQQISTSGLAPQVYFMQINTNQGSFSDKLIVK